MDINEIFLKYSLKTFKLVVPSSSRPVYLSKKVIHSSSLLMDMLEYVNDEDPGYELMTSVVTKS